MTRVGWVDLQLKGCELGSFLLHSSELLKAALEAVGERPWDQELSCCYQMQ
jgi:hypothetical protein